MLTFMKRVILLAGILFYGLPGFSAQPKFVLITDVDDTIKVSHIDDTMNKVIRFFSEPVAFAGMSELYGEMMNAATARGFHSNFIVLSGTPEIFESSVLDFLSIFSFPDALRVITRPMMMDTEEYKTEAVTLVVGHPVMKGAAIIMIGDDTEHDEAAYSNSLAAQGATPGFESQIYIRRVMGTATTTRTSIAFDSAADIAIVEFLKGRLSKASAERILSIVLKEKRFDRLFVPGEYCPTAKSPRLSEDLKSASVDVDLVKQLVRVEDHLRERCSSLNAMSADIFE